MREWQSQTHVKWYCRYHVVIVPKYRRKSMFRAIRREVGETFKELCRRSLEYLASFVFKVAISDSRIVRVENHTATFKFRERGTNLYRTTSLDVLEFLRRFLQHVLPRGFMKVRHYGFLSVNSAVPIHTVRNLIDQYSGPPVPQSLPEPPRPRCPNCGGPLVPLYSSWSTRESPFVPALRDTG